MRATRTHWFLACLALAGCAASPHAAFGTGPRNAVHWPESFAPGDAALFSHNEAVIAAPCERVWSQLIAAASWPAWYENARDVHVVDGGSGTLRDKTTFRWLTFGIAVESQVREYVPETRLAWFGRAPGMSAYHAWLLNPLSDGCHVVTEETNNGPSAIALRRTKPEAIHDGHAIWLAQLKRVSEK